MAKGQEDGDLFAKVGERLRTIFEMSKGESLRLSKVGRIHLDIAGLKGKRDRLIRDLGEESYRLLLAGKCAIGVLQHAVDEITALDRRIAGREAEIDGLRGGEKEAGESAGEGTQGPTP